MSTEEDTEFPALCIAVPRLRMLEGYDGHSSPLWPSWASIGLTYLEAHIREVADGLLAHLT